MPLRAPFRPEMANVPADSGNLASAAGVTPDPCPAAAVALGLVAAASGRAVAASGAAGDEWPQAAAVMATKTSVARAAGACVLGCLMVEGPLTSRVPKPLERTRRGARPVPFAFSQKSARFLGFWVSVRSASALAASTERDRKYRACTWLARSTELGPGQYLVRSKRVGAQSWERFSRRRAAAGWPCEAARTELLLTARATPPATRRHRQTGWRASGAR